MATEEPASDAELSPDELAENPSQEQETPAQEEDTLDSNKDPELVEERLEEGEFGLEKEYLFTKEEISNVN